MIKPQIKAYLLQGNSKNLINMFSNENILGIIEFSQNKGIYNYKTNNSNFPYLHVNMKPFFNDSYYEIWTSTQPVSYGRSSNLQYATDGYHFFAAISMSDKSNTMEYIGEITYNCIFESVKEYNYPHIARMWSYIPYINQISNENERYKSFCYGRAVSFQNNHDIYPAATGIGSFGDAVNICFISTVDNIHKNIENPNQVPAYKYPSQYGIKPPNFSRATYSQYDQSENKLYVSGTASILGHETVFEDDVIKQCETTIKNIETLISKSNLETYGIAKGYSLEDLDCIKVYIKNEKDIFDVKEICDKVFSSSKSIAYLEGDICRSGLLVEIEGLISK